MGDSKCCTESSVSVADALAMSVQDDIASGNIFYTVHELLLILNGFLDLEDIFATHTHEKY